MVGQQLVTPGLHRGGARRRVHLQRPVDAFQKGRAELPLAQLNGARHCGPGGTILGVGRLVARHRPVQGAAHRVEVGPDPLLTQAVLLQRRVAGRHHHGVLVGQGHRLPGRPEVQQHQAAVVVAHLDVVGLDVAVQVAGGVHGRQPVQQRLQAPGQQALAAPVVAVLLRPPLLERSAAFVLQHHVGGAVGLEETCHAHDVRVAEGGQRARFGQKTFQPLLVAVAVA
jgi:hypothetical protein